MDQANFATPGKIIFHAADRLSRRLTRICLAACLVSAFALAQDDIRVNPAGTPPADSRLNPLRTLNDKYHPWTPPQTLDAWEAEAERIRTQVLVSNGLWPMPEKTPLNPVVHGKVDRGDYTVEKVYFASRPGLYVTGSLFKPKKINGKIPGVLCPHGHWNNGRFYDAGNEGAAGQLEIGAEQFMSGAHHPVQARMVQLARMGCVVFHYDMIGYADNQPLVHRDGFNDVDAVLRLQNKMGLQTWNSIRAADFLLSMPEVDPSRLACTGASGGGTQTFMLGAVDPRIAVAFPAVMVSTAMQGGCVCENADYLRQGINNIALAALFAPRPMAMSGADDWTIDIETKGLPELQFVYALYGKSSLVQARCFSQFKHNYNQPAREMMYDWMNEHLNLGHDSPVAQSDFWPLSQEEMTVFDKDHPLPDDSLPAEKLRAVLTEENNTWLDGLFSSAAADSSDSRRILRAAQQVMLGGPIPSPSDVTGSHSETEVGDFKLIKVSLSRTGSGQAIPLVVGVRKGTHPEKAVIWIDGKGKGGLSTSEGDPLPGVQELLEKGYAVISPDLFLTGEYVDGIANPHAYNVNSGYPGFTFGYNRPLLTERVQDILTVLAAVQKHGEVRDNIHLVGTGAAGVWVALARGLMPADVVKSTTVDLQGFSFAQITDPQHPNLLPGALKYGGMGGLLSLAAPARLTLYGVTDKNRIEVESAARLYTGPASSAIQFKSESLTDAAIAHQITNE